MKRNTYLYSSPQTQDDYRPITLTYEELTELYEKAREKYHNTKNSQVNEEFFFNIARNTEKLLSSMQVSYEVWIHYTALEKIETNFQLPPSMKTKIQTVYKEYEYTNELV